MKLLLLGSGAREHALAWKFSGEHSVSEILCAPGNAGIAQHARCVPLDVGDSKAVLALAESEGVDFTVVGPELPLACGVADIFAEAGHILFGPLQAAARLESSKVFAKEFMKRHQIPTARFKVCQNATEAMSIVSGKNFGFPVVIKADGLAAGKGVTVASDRRAAEAAVATAMIERKFGDAGTRLVIEECLVGQEVSFFVLCDGHQGLVLPSAQDYKRVFDGDDGPNTGGMGAFAPSPLISKELSSEVMTKIAMPVLRGFQAEGIEYRGVLYIGLMLTDSGPKVIEFNVRLGDPEAQVILPMIETDLAPLFFSAARGKLSSESFRINMNPQVGVVIASGGYPGHYETGFPIVGLDKAVQFSGIKIFHSGSTNLNGNLVTNGGRVLTVVGSGLTYEEAINCVYRAVTCVSFQGKHVRNDIGQKALESNRNKQLGMR